MQKTKVINDTGTKLTVKMSNNGIITKLRDGDVESGQSYTISIDPNATYREYWCAVLPNTNPPAKAILSSDDCAEFLEVKIVKDDTVNPPVYSWKGTKPRSNKKPRIQKPQGSAVSPPSPSPGTPDDAKSCLIL